MIDLYKRGCFILEAKQSRARGGKKEVSAGNGELFPLEDVSTKRAGQWDVLMLNAKSQAEGYARLLPPHP